MCRWGKATDEPLHAAPSDNGSRMNSANALTSKPPQFCTSFLLFRPSETTDLVQQQ